ncbi:hypothetical protein TRV_06754 [Trichophyton verrucosum HKI 0517]|uniref:Uncharacterized protein n=1 Tax=Trichophyton verrucosum (strain HKI 0517) TaxID=663202 RepID=D4DHU7_TRIVH|nr:uncharacterized protein TRV_06754 [Trichophyton verrucosum HKI 0517]EFE38560.1 hypothetical protein TRV_06754 [Trichophyton verrucosum HKI 0517]
MSSETSGGFSGGVSGGNQAGRAGTAGAGATDPTRAGGGAAKESVREMGQGVKSAAAGAHGFGERVRGSAGAFVDRAMNDPEGAAKNERVVREGQKEMHTGDFSHSTREKEGLPHSEREVNMQKGAGTAQPPPEYY